jgi:hypothetical protein
MENIFKSWATTLFGLALWGIAVYEFFFDKDSAIEAWQAGLMVVGGFALLWMRDSVSQWINSWVQKKVNKE